MPETKWEITPVAIGFIIGAIGVIMYINNFYPLWGKAFIPFGISIIFAILASKSGQGTNPLFLFTLTVAIGSFIAFAILLVTALSSLQGNL